jgi:sugar O-acyltransferase (sialic acid O-acetyltransferase NeuD family)
VSDKKEVILVGYSGHGFVVAEAALNSGLLLKYYVDKKIALLDPFDLNYLGHEEDLNFSGWGGKNDFVLGIGDNLARERIAELIISKKGNILTVLHPDTTISEIANIGEGVFVARNVSINLLVSIGNYCILNTGAIIDHECILGNCVHVAPGAVLAGNVRVGDRAFIGANSVVKQGITIGRDAIIGAGSVVIRDVPDGGKFAGNPAKLIK